MADPLPGETFDRLPLDNPDQAHCRRIEPHRIEVTPGEERVVRLACHPADHMLAPVDHHPRIRSDRPDERFAGRQVVISDGRKTGGHPENPPHQAVAQHHLLPRLVAPDPRLESGAVNQPVILDSIVRRRQGENGTANQQIQSYTDP